ncbi:uncharacterized protein LOC141655711 [Silene latifolia]|uniref:uncharacterized protein LOC141655711 n=1 Tax=Silene latifolia TaxID=37657 RepID=UPI003D7855A2
MARSSTSNSPKKHNKSSISNGSVKGSDRRTGGEKKQGPEEEDVLRTKPMHEVNTIHGLSFEDEENPDSIQWVTQRGKKQGARSQVVVTDESIESTGEDLLQFTPDDVSEEITYWNRVISCFVLGANPPWGVLQGYVHRIWGKHGIDKVFFLPNGIFLVRFKEMKDKDEVLNAGYHMFDNKPLIVKPWQEDIDLLKEEVKVVPAWIRIHGLPLKFWGTCLPSIAGLVGPYVKSDAATTNKTRLGFARTMVELKVGQGFPSYVKFRDENGKIVILNVECEWKPILCDKCKGLGHEGKNCRRDQIRNAQSKPTVKKVWRPIPKNVNNPAVSDKEFPALSTRASPRVIENTTSEPVAAAGPFVSAAEPPDNAKDDVSIQVEDITDEENENLENQRLDLWDKLKSVAGQCDMPWALAGDFNTVISPEERLGAATKQEDMDTFNDCLSACGMMDITATGAYFTWTNKREVGHRKYSRLDRFLVNQEWVDMFPDMHAHFHPEGLMDHTPCIVRNVKLDGRRSNSFKYFNMWSDAPTFLDTVKGYWSQQIDGTKMFGVVKKLKALKGGLKNLNKECFSDALDEVRFWSKARDSFLQQKAKAQWIDEGDSNAAYFHNVIKKICLRNKIVQIEDQNGKLCTDTLSIQDAFLKFYQGLLGSKKVTEQVRMEVLQTGFFCSDQHCTSLLSPVSKEEIKGAVFSIPKDKAPGPDGYTSGFVRDSWDIVGDEVCSVVMDFFTTGCLLTQINATNITLIPKCDRPTAVSHFRPIACCNLIYKVISKLLCNRLATVLPDIIHENQGAFIKGRSIIENVLICQDIIHLYSRKAVTPRCLFKIDLQKAYDTVEWDFVEQMLHGLKFPSHFIQLVMQCVRSTSFTLSLNGNNFGYFKGQKGLRQGDPISPLIFIICMEYLTRLIKFATDRWPFQYHPLCKNLKLTHLMFADDLLLFCKGKPRSIWLLLRAFSSFSKASGLAMNNAKSEIFFNGVSEDIREGIKHVAGFREGIMPFRYLGVPIKAGRLTKKECSALTEKMVARIRGLGAKKLSYAGRVTLINAVLNTLQNYWAQMFIIPKSIINHIMAICRNFLWDGSPDYHRVPLVAWDKVTLPKKEGGLGIKKADVWNIATVGKLVNWIYCKADRLWNKWINYVYIKNQDWHNYSPPADATWVWKNVCKVKEKRKDGFHDSKWTMSTKGYSIKEGYAWLAPDQPTLNWTNIVWNNWNIPKHSLTTWLRMNEGMNMKSKLFRFGCCTDDWCILCQRQPETVEHLFTSRVYSVRVQSCMLHWINGWLSRPEVVAVRIEDDIKRMVKMKCRVVVDQSDLLWLQNVVLVDQAAHYLRAHVGGPVDGNKVEIRQVARDLETGHVSWLEFQELLKNEFMPEFQKAKLQEEFDTFKMTEDMTVEAYHRTFRQLCSYIDNFGQNEAMLAMRPIRKARPRKGSGDHERYLGAKKQSSGRYGGYSTNSAPGGMRAQSGGGFRGTSGGGSSAGITCFGCGKTGHKRFECRSSGVNRSGGYRAPMSGLSGSRSVGCRYNDYRTPMCGYGGGASVELV